MLDNTFFRILALALAAACIYASWRGVRHKHIALWRLTGSGYSAVITGRFFAAAGVLFLVSIVIPCLFLVAILVLLMAFSTANYYRRLESGNE